MTTIDFQQQQPQQQPQQQQLLQQDQRRLQDDDGDDDKDSCCSTCDYANATPSPVRIVTSSHIAPTLQLYVNFFNQLNGDNEDDDEVDDENSSSSSSSPKRIRLSVLSSFQELHWEAVFDAKVQSGLYDGFVIPPMMIGSLYEHQGLASLESFRSTRIWDDLLPYYKHAVATYDSTIRSIPLFSGNQMLLLFRKDYLDARNMPTPKTWSDLTRVAAALHEEPLGEGGERIYGVCLGRMSEEACRRKVDTTGEGCQSLSMTYLGMALASMTQPKGNTTGWLFDDHVGSGHTMEALLNGTLERTLLSMEELMQYGAPEELTLDGSVNIDFFAAGRCAMTFAADHPDDLLQDENVGFVPLPGANEVFDRKTKELVPCTEERCPHGTSYTNNKFGTDNDGDDDNDLGIVNRAPFGAHDMVVGGVSAFASQYNQDLIKEFFEFVLTTRLNISVREQPMTFSQLQSSNVEGYLELMEELTSNENVAIPFRVPGAFPMLSDLDNRVYNYLLEGNYSSAKREELRKGVEETWTRQIRRRDNQFGAVPTSIFYEKSLGIFAAEPASDLYIGDVARYIGWGFGAFSCLMSLYCALWVWKNKSKRVVSASQPIFLWLVCLGTFVMAACVFPFGFENDFASQRVCDIACMATFWFYSLGYVLIFCVLFSKIWRVNQIFRSTNNLQRIQVETLDVLLPFGVLFGINFVILMIWNVTDPVRWYRYPIEDPDTELALVEESTFGTCDSESYRFYLGILIGVNLIISLTALIQAYECRRISTEFNEILWISGALCIVVEVWLIGLPVLKLLGDNPQWTFITKTAIVFMTSFSVLVCVFFPKMKYLYDLSEEELKKEYTEAAKLTHQDHTEGSHDPDGDLGASVRVPGLEPPSSMHRAKAAGAGMVGIRIIQSSSRHSEEVVRLESSIKKAEKRNRVLQDRLERLQDQLEHYLVAHSSHDHDNILMARPEQARHSGGWSEGSYRS